MMICLGALPLFCFQGLAGGFWSGGSGGPSERRALPYPVQRWEPWCGHVLGVFRLGMGLDTYRYQLFSGMNIHESQLNFGVD